MGLEWSDRGKLWGRTCTKIQLKNKPSSWSWNNNYLCYPPDSIYRFYWSADRPYSGMSCLRVTDEVKRKNYYLCARKRSGVKKRKYEFARIGYLSIILRDRTEYYAPCKQTQHVGATSPNIVGIVLGDVGFRVFKRPQHVGQCCFYGNTEGNFGLIFTPKLFGKLQCCHVRRPLWRWMNADDGKRENMSLLLMFSANLKILSVTQTR